MRSPVLTLNVPSPPDGIVQANLVPPKKFQAFEVLPFWGHQSPTNGDKNNNTQDRVTKGFSLDWLQQFYAVTLEAHYLASLNMVEHPQFSLLSTFSYWAFRPLTHPVLKHWFNSICLLSHPGLWQHLFFLHKYSALITCPCARVSFPWTLLPVLAGFHPMHLVSHDKLQVWVLAHMFPLQHKEPTFHTFKLPLAHCPNNQKHFFLQHKCTRTEKHDEILNWTHTLTHGGYSYIAIN